MLHKHHIVPRHAGGSDDPSNIELISVEEHAERHRILFEKYGCWQDELAWNTLSGQIGKDEARRKAASLTNTGKRYALGCKHKPRSSEWKRKQSLAHKGQFVSEEVRNLMSLRMQGNSITLGRKRPLEERLQIGMKLKGITHKRIQCPYCNKIGGTSVMHRWHLDNCNLINSKQNA